MAILSTIAKERGRAVLVVTHDPRLFRFADRIVQIEDGRLTCEESNARSGIEQASEGTKFHMPPPAA